MVLETKRRARVVHGSFGKYISETYIIACQELCEFKGGICYPVIHLPAPSS